MVIELNGFDEQRFAETISLLISHEYRIHF